MRKDLIKKLIIAALFMLVTGNEANGADKNFREEFAAAYKSLRFDATVLIVRQNRDRVPSEVRSIIKEALAEGKTYNERMEMLGMASAMAAIHKHWHDDGAPLAEVEAMIKNEDEKEKTLSAKLARWARFETTPGNIVMRTFEKEMSAKDLSPVIFPHWTHRLYYKCSACHDRLFRMERGAASTHADMEAGASCGACHNGKTAFGAGRDGTNCEICHNAGKPSGEALLAPLSTDLEKTAITAMRLGLEFKKGVKPARKLPADKAGDIDWESFEKTETYERAGAPEGNRAERFTVILYRPKLAGVKSVEFSHKTHTEEIDCASCHPRVFRETSGGNEIKMSAMAEGRFCAACHSRISFGFKDCAACHRVDAEKADANRIPGKQVRFNTPSNPNPRASSTGKAGL